MNIWGGGRGWKQRDEYSTLTLNANEFRVNFISLP